MKRTTYLISISAFCLLALVACSKESLMQDIPQGSVPVGFSSDLPATKAASEYTKATDFTNENLTDMGVFTYFTHGNFDPDIATPNYMYNQKVEKNTNNNIDYPWTYSPVKFWPTNGTDLLSFFAYAPYVDGAVNSNPVPSERTQTGFPSLAYTVPTDEADQIDLLAAVPQMNRTYSDNNGGTVTFPLKHALTKIAIYIKSGDDIAGKKVTAFSIQATQKGTLTFCASAAGNDNGFAWSFPEPAMVTFIPTTSELDVPDNITAEKILLATFYFLPNTGSTFSISYTYPGLATGESQSISLTDKPLPSTDSWTPGAFISYTIGIAKKEVTVTATEHYDWQYGGSGTVIGGISFEDISSDIPDWQPGGSGSVNGEEKTDNVDNIVNK